MLSQYPLGRGCSERSRKQFTVHRTGATPLDQRDDLASRSRANCPLRTPSVFRNCPKCSSTLAFDIWHTRCCVGLPGDIGDVGTLGIPIPPRDQARDRGRCTRSVLGGASGAMARHSCVAVLASALVAMYRAVVIVIARPRTRSRRRSLMTARLYGLWVLSVILALMLEFLTPGMLTLLPVPW